MLMLSLRAAFFLLVTTVTASAQSEPLLGFDHSGHSILTGRHREDGSAIMQPVTQVAAIHTAKQAERVGLAAGDLIVNIKADGHPALDEKDDPRQPRQWGHQYPNQPEILAYINKFYSRADLTFSVLRQDKRLDVKFPASAPPPDSKDPKKSPPAELQSCFQFWRGPFHTSGFTKAKCDLNAIPPGRSQVLCGACELRAKPDCKMLCTDPEQARADAKKKAADNTYTYAHSPTLKEQQAQCHKGRNTACIDLHHYQDLALSCLTHYWQCDEALKYPFADRIQLDTNATAETTYRANAKACLVARPEPCRRALASPVATSPHYAQMTQAIREVLNLAETLTPKKQAKDKTATAQPIAKPKVTAPAKPKPPQPMQAATQRPATMFTPSFFAMLGLAAAMLLTATLATPTTVRQTGYGADEHERTATPKTVANHLHRYVVTNPIAVVKFVFTVCLIAGAIWFALTFTLIAMGFFAIAGAAAIYAAVKK